MQKPEFEVIRITEQFMMGSGCNPDRDMCTEDCSEVRWGCLAVCVGNFEDCGQWT